MVITTIILILLVLTIVSIILKRVLRINLKDITKRYYDCEDETCSDD